MKGKNVWHLNFFISSTSLACTFGFNDAFSLLMKAKCKSPTLFSLLQLQSLFLIVIIE